MEQAKLLQHGKQIIKEGKIESVQLLYKTIKHKSKHVKMNIEYMFCQLFNCACQHSKKDIIHRLLQMYFESFPETQMIALRQFFFYGKYLIKNQRVKSWYASSVIPIFKQKA